MGREISTSGGRVGGSTWYNIFIFYKQKIVAGAKNIC